MSNIAELLDLSSRNSTITVLDDVRSLDPVNDILETVRAHLDMDVAFISRQVGQTHRVFTHVSANGETELKPGTTNSNDNSLCWLVIQGRLPQRICDVSAYEAARDLPVTTQLGVGSHFSVPMKRRDGSVHGSLCCYSHQPRPEITERDMRLLRSAAAIISDQIESRIEIEEREKAANQELDALFEEGALTIYHQPIVEIAQRRLIGHECLLRRTNRPDESPSALFETAQFAGRRFELEMHAAAHALATLECIGPGQFISINVSPSTMVHDAFWSLIPHGLADRLVIELTENQTISDYGAVKRAIDRLRNKAWIAIDDVGAGFSGLQHLVELHPDLLKMDRDLIVGVDEDPARRALATAMVQFASETGCALIAEGVETMKDLQALQNLGIIYAQGFALGRPSHPADWQSER